MVLARIISSWSKYVVCTEATPWIHRCAAILSVLLQLVKPEPAVHCYGVLVSFDQHKSLNERLRCGYGGHLCLNLIL